MGYFGKLQWFSCTILVRKLESEPLEKWSELCSRPFIFLLTKVFLCNFGEELEREPLGHNSVSDPKKWIIHSYCPEFVSILLNFNGFLCNLGISLSGYFYIKLVTWNLRIKPKSSIHHFIFLKKICVYLRDRLA